MNKYNAKRTTVGDVQFHSAAEAREYNRLKQLEDAGKIADLRIQPEFSCEINGSLICKYRADFSFIRNGTRVVVDVKGMETAVFKIKRKLVEAMHGVEIKLIPA